MKIILPLDSRRAGRAALVCRTCQRHSVALCGRAGAYKSDQAEEVDIKIFLPLVNVGHGNLADLAQDAVVQHQAVKLAKRFDGDVNCLFSEREISQVTVDHLNLIAILLLQFLERLETARNHDNIVCLGCSEEVLGNRQTDTYDVVSPS